MPIQGLDISLNVVNNTNYPQQINVMGNPTNLLDTANATREFRWNFTGFTITYENEINIQYKTNADPTYSIYTSGLNGTSLSDVVYALNGLQIGYFNLYEELGQTYIGTYNENYMFGTIELFPLSVALATQSNLNLNTQGGDTLIVQAV